MTPINSSSRYSRHELLKEFGKQGQHLLDKAHVLIIGAGGVGCPAALYLAESGVGTLTIVDADSVEESNLPRQILHTPSRIGINKALSAQTALKQINPSICVHAIDQWADDQLLQSLATSVDVILDCSDNFKTRHSSNRIAKSLGKPLISASAIRFSIQVATFDFSNPTTPCYQCTFPEDNEQDVKASLTGVFAPATGLAGLIAAEQAMKLIVGLPNLSGQLLLIDTLSWSTDLLTLSRDPNCPICSRHI